MVNIISIMLEGKVGEGLFTMIDAEQKDKITEYKWFGRQRKDGKVEAYTRWVDVKKGNIIKQTMHHMIAGLKPGSKTRIQHINSDTLNNLRSNLQVTISEKKKKVTKSDGMTPKASPSVPDTDDIPVVVMLTDNEAVKKAVKYFVDKQEAFTSVDISNYIKKELVHWTRVSIAATILKHGCKSMDLEFVVVTVSTVEGTLANLYYASDCDPRDYTGSDQKAITPVEFEKIKKGANDGTKVSGDGD